ncbi:MAG: glycoside hydrolase family 10 protein [Phycisphaerales bacterium JB040]
MPIVRLLLAVLTAFSSGTGCASGFSAGVHRDSADRAFRGMWVTRWDYITRDDVREIMDNCERLGVTDVIWQVRGQADAYYPSELEPWGEHLFRDPSAPGEDPKPTPAQLRDGPGFDPLALAVSEAHARGMRLHAWVNVMPLWRGTTPPLAPDHPWRARPDLRLKDRSGTDQPLNDHYVIMNPALDDTHDHIVAVMDDIASRYNIDGLHLDYIRFVSELHEEAKLYPGDPATVALFEAQTGEIFTQTEDGLRQYRRWVRDRITTLVRRIHDEVIMRRPGRMLSAAVWRRPDLAQGYLQDAERWLRQGLLDLAIPMIYTDNDAQYAGDLDAWRAAAGSQRDLVVPGVGSYKHPSGEQTLRQLESSGSRDRHVLFAYSTYFESRAPDLDRTEAGRRLREAHRAPLLRAGRP